MKYVNTCTNKYFHGRMYNNLLTKTVQDNSLLGAKLNFTVSQTTTGAILDISLFEDNSV